MKPILIGIVFLFVYGLFSIKSHAAEDEPAAHAIFTVNEGSRISLCQAGTMRVVVDGLSAAKPKS